MIANIPPITSDEFQNALKFCFIESAKGGMSASPSMDEFTREFTKHAAKFFEAKPDVARAFTYRFFAAYREIRGKRLPAIPMSLFDFVSSAPLQAGGQFDPAALAKAARGGT